MHAPDTYLVPVPDPGPPYDCDIHGTTCQSPGAPAPSRPGPGTGGPAPSQPGTGGAALGPVSRSSLVPGGTAAPRGDPTTPGPLASSVGAAWPRQFAQAIAETLAGVRPIRQLIPWTTERALARIQTLCPLFRTDSGPRIQRVLSSCPSADVAEVTVIAGFGPRTRALALRFEHIAARQPAPGLSGRPARWLCTDIETG